MVFAFAGDSTTTRVPPPAVALRAVPLAGARFAAFAFAFVSVPSFATRAGMVLRGSFIYVRRRK
jgi:hypothetical protein